MIRTVSSARSVSLPLSLARNGNGAAQGTELRCLLGEIAA
jgi:hypothetical protein